MQLLRSLFLQKDRFPAAHSTTGSSMVSFATIIHNLIVKLLLNYCKYRGILKV